MKTTVSSASVFPVTRDDLVQDFRSLGILPGQTLLVHASLSRIGWVVGGPETVVRALFDVLGPTGTLMTPAQSWKNLDPATGVHWEQPEAWWPVLRAHWPAFDPLVTPSIGMGAVAETIRTWPGAIRSSHPARSFAAVGPKALDLMADHDLCNIFGRGSPLDKLGQAGGQILLIGVDHDKNTSLHLAEMRADLKNRSFSEESSAVLENGVRVWKTYRTPSVDDHDFVTLGRAWEAYSGTQPGRVGQARTVLIPQSSFVDWAAAWLSEHRR